MNNTGDRNQTYVGYDMSFFPPFRSECLKVSDLIEVTENQKYQINFNDYSAISIIGACTYVCSDRPSQEERVTLFEQWNVESCPNLHLIITPLDRENFRIWVWEKRKNIHV